MTPTHPTLLFTSLAVILGLGALLLPPIDPPSSSFADTFTLWGISHGKNVLSAFILTITGIYGLTCRPRFELATEVLTSMVICCIGMVVAGPVGAWFHLSLSSTSFIMTHVIMSLALLNASFAIIATQLPLKGRWWLFAGLQCIALLSVMYEYVYRDQRFKLMAEIFCVLVIIFSLLRVWRISASKYLLWCLLSLCSSWLVGSLDNEISQWSSYLVSGHTLQHLLWAGAGFFWLRYFTLVRPRDLSELLPN